MRYKHKPEPQEDIVVGNVLDAQTAKQISEALENQELEYDLAFRRVEKDGGWELIEVSLVKRR